MNYICTALYLLNANKFFRFEFRRMSGNPYALQMKYLSSEEEKKEEHQKLEKLEKLSGEETSEDVQVAFHDLHPKTQRFLQAGMKICEEELSEKEVKEN